MRAASLIIQRGTALVATAMGGLLLFLLFFLALSHSASFVHADPIEPPEGYPKFNTSIKIVTPTLAGTSGETLWYNIEIRNTGAYTAAGVTVADTIPDNATYNHDAQASVPSTFSFANGILTWMGDVGFDATVVLTFSVDVDAGFAGVVENTAVISHSLMAQAVSITAQTVVTDDPILTIAKSSQPDLPGANKPMTYTLIVGNQGQPAQDLSLTVVDRLPENTSLRSIGPDGSADGDLITWMRTVDLALGETTIFTFSVDVDDVISGTAIVNDDYSVSAPDLGITPGEPHTVTVVSPILRLVKETWPDPPGSNREMTYILTLLNRGSLATGLVITDRVPAGVAYVDGGSESDGVVSWTYPSLATGETAQFTFTVEVGDVMDVAIVNDDYGVCSAEGICQTGQTLTSVVRGPQFAATAELDPIAHQPGGGQSQVTPTLTIENLGPGNALDATALLYFHNIRVVNVGDLEVIPPRGAISPGPACGDECRAYVWVGDIFYEETLTFITTYNIAQGHRGRTTVGGDGGMYTTTVVITDSLGGLVTEPISATAEGRITTNANLIPQKSAPKYVGRGQPLTYTIEVVNTGLSTESGGWLTDTVPLDVALMNVSHNGTTATVGNRVVVSWPLPDMGPADRLERFFAVRADDDLVSGTHIVNDDYWASWTKGGELYANMGDPITTTVRDVGLVDSFKLATPTLALPGPDNILTYTVHVVNSAPFTLYEVSLYDYLPWQHSTYQRDAVASAGEIISDIVSIQWQGAVGAMSSEIITFTVLVDADFQGAITNTAVISHFALLEPVEVYAVAYITDKPVLQISKSASPSSVQVGDEIEYTLRVVNRGWPATGLIVTDTIPQNTVYVAGSASGNGQLVNGQVRWEIGQLGVNENRTFTFRVEVTGGQEIVNDAYGVISAEGVSAVGPPVITPVGSAGMLYLPVILR